MVILVACEESQEVCKAFRERGHEAFSCDVVNCSGGHPEWHIKGDVTPLLRSGYHFFDTMDGMAHCKAWDMILAFPPCTHLASSGARHFEEKRKDGRQLAAIKFFYKMINAGCDKICVENPVGIISGKYIEQFGYKPLKPTQIIQPFMFGHAVSKKTCLWLKGLPALKPTNIVEPELIHSKGKTGGYSGALWYATDENGKILNWNDPRTATARSKTFHGIAEAMAEQWGGNKYTTADDELLHGNKNV